MNRSPFAAALGLALGLGAVPAAASAFELIPMVGMADLDNEDGDADYDAGLALGVMLGGRVSERVSLLGHVHFHPLTTNDDDEEGRLTLVQFVPLFHVVTEDTFTLSLGPALGGFDLSIDVDLGFDDATLSVTGWSIGAVVGAFFNVSDTFSIGPTVQYGKIYATEVCAESGGSQQCDDVDDDDGLTVLLVNAGAMLRF